MVKRRLSALSARLGSLYPVRLARAFADSQAPNYAAGLAFNMFMSMFPLLLGLLAIVGLVLRSPTQQASVEATLLSFFPPDAQAALHRTLTGARQHAGLLGLISILGLIWSGSGLFASMEFALGQIFGARQRDFVRQRVMALFMTAVFVVAIVVSTFASASLAFVHGVPFVGPVIGAVTWFLFMLLIYRVVPNRTFSTQSHVWPGALLAAVLMEALTLIWPLFARLMHGFDTYGSTFALFFLLATWLYLLAQVLLLGAVASRMGQGTPKKEGLAAVPQPDVVQAGAPQR
jgi:membrane protein